MIFIEGESDMKNHRNRLRDRWSAIALGTVVGLPIITFTAQPAQAIDVRFTLANETDSALTRVYIAPSGGENWGKEKLGGRPLTTHDSREVSLSDSRESCLYDIKGVFENGDEVADFEIDLCALNGDGNYTFYGDNDREIKLINNTQAEIVAIYISTDSEVGEENLLGDYRIKPKESVQIFVPLNDCVHSVRGVFSDGKEEVQDDLDLCNSSIITFVDLAFDRGPLTGYDSLPLNIQNQTEDPLMEFYATPVGSDDWGFDLLEGEPIPPGTSRTINMFTLECLYDIQAIFLRSDNRETSRVDQLDVDLCDLNPTISYPFQN
jgi:hypothetical protein